MIGRPVLRDQQNNLVSRINIFNIYIQMLYIKYYVFSLLNNYFHHLQRTLLVISIYALIKHFMFQTSQAGGRIAFF